jgi:butyryl-CoA dehydrogenase
MDFNLSEQQLILRRTVRDFAEAEIAPVAQELDEREEFPYEIFKKLGEMGMIGIPFPEEYGGTAAGALSEVIVLEELTRVNTSVGGGMEANITLGGFPLHHFGSHEQKQRWLTPLAQGKILGAFGLTEPEAGSDAGACKTTAVLDGDEWVVNGTKCFITNAGTDMSGFVTVMAVTGQRKDGRKELSNIIIPKGTPGYNIAPPYKKMSFHASDTRELSFENCRVPRENLIGEKGAGFHQFLATLDEGRTMIGALSLGAIQGCFDLSLNYSRERVQFGKPIFQFQAIQFKLADMAVAAETARLLVYKAAALEDEGKPFAREAAMAKLYASELALKCANEAVQIHGGYGIMNDFAVSRFYRDVKVFTIGEGTSEVMRIVIARHL